MIRHCSGFLLLVAVCLAACGDPEVPGGEITIQNHILDKHYNSFVIDRVITKRGMTAFRKTLKPNEQIVLPYKGISSMRFTRKYEDHSRVYVVHCPSDFNKKVMMKLIDVHTNRLRGGCKLTKRGKKEEGGYVRWE